MTLVPTVGTGGLRRAFLRPRSVGLLVLALVLAAAFAGLAQWQISRAVDQGTVVARATEQRVQLRSVAKPGEQQTDASVGQLVEARGRLLPQDTLLARDRLNRGRSGWWVLGHAVVDDPSGAQLAVALGWAPDRASAEAAAERARRAAPTSQALVGRYIDSDGAEPTASGSPSGLDSVSAARLLNLWTADVDGPTYEGVLTLQEAPDGLTSIYSPRPGEEVELNLLNVLYAAEWVLFAVAAFYIWYRLVRDRWEQEQQEADGAEEQGAADRSEVSA